MFLRIVKDSFARQPRRKLLTAVALALATAVATATLSVALDVGDRLASEFRSLGANLLVTPQADALPLEIGGVDYRPVDSGAYLPEADLGKLKTIFWRNNIIGFAPSLDVPVELGAAGRSPASGSSAVSMVLIGTWYRHEVAVPKGGGTFTTGVAATNPWWRVDGRWFGDNAAECVVGAALARRAGITTGQTLEVHSGERTMQLRVVGIAATGGQEDDAILAPLAAAQQLSNRPGQYRHLLVSALTKPEDAFSQRNPSSMTPVEFESWYCSPYISSISRQIQEQLPGVEVRPIRQIAEGEGRILTRVERADVVGHCGGVVCSGAGCGGHGGHYGAGARQRNRLDEGFGRSANHGRRVLFGRAVAAGVAGRRGRLCHGTRTGSLCGRAHFRHIAGVASDSATHRFGRGGRRRHTRESRSLAKSDAARSRPGVARGLKLRRKRRRPAGFGKNRKMSKVIKE